MGSELMREEVTPSPFLVAPIPQRIVCSVQDTLTAHGLSGDEGFYGYEQNNILWLRNYFY